MDSEVMKGLSECETLESNVRRIQVKDIVKEVEDYLKTYSSAGMDISWKLNKFLWKDNHWFKLKPVPSTKLAKVVNSWQNCSLKGSMKANVPAFDKEDFTSWKVRFLVFLDGLEPYLLKTLEDGPFVPMSSLSTTENPLPKRQNQWSNAESRLANQDKRLKSIIISCLPNDVMKSVIKCKTAKEMWNDLILAHEGPSDTRDTKIAALRLKFNAFKSLEGEKVMGTFTRLKCLLNDLENNGVTIPQAEVNATFVNSLPRKWLSMNQTQRANNSIKNDSLATLYGKYNYEEDYKGKYKGLKAEMVVLTQRIDDLTKGKSEKGKSDKGKSEKGLIAESFDWDEESVSSEDEGTTRIRAFMAIAEDEPSVGKADARSGQWVDITMKKVHRLLSMTDSDDRKHVLDYTHVDLIYVEDQRKNMVNKYNLLKQELSLHKSELSNLKNTVSINCSLQNEVIRVNLENESLKDEISNLKSVIEKWTCSKVTLDQLLSEQILGIIADVSTSESAPMITSDSEDDSDIQEPLPPLLKLTGADPSGASKSRISLSDLTANMADLTLNTASKEIKKSSNKDYLKRFVWYLDSGCSRHMTGVKQYLHRYSKELGAKVVFRDDSLGDTEGYDLVNCNGITFTRVAYVNDEYSRKMENLNEVRVKELRSDNGTEFRNHKLEEFYDEKGISQNFSSPCTPEQNGVAERRNRTLIEAARTMLNSAKLPKQFWGEAVNTACYTQNRSIIVKRHGKTAYDVFRGRAPDISYLYVFGCPVHIHNHRDHLGKFDEKADDGFFLGYSPVAKAFRVFNIRRQEMEETVHVTFSEDDEAISQTSTEGDAINFNENRSFPDDEFIEPRTKDTQCSINIEYFPYVSAYENTTSGVLPTLQNYVTSEDPSEFTIADDLAAIHEPDHAEPADILESAKPQDNVLSESTSDDQPAPVILPSAEVIL
ncbi:retrovirus-related pol polyprotein from transposon TNT 1-94 [Tanacetum coccineum]